MNKFLEIFREVWQVEFSRGALCAAGVFLAVLILYWILKIIVFCKFGRRRCSTVTVSREHGDIVISADAVSAALRSELSQFIELDIRRILLFRKRKIYSVEIRCALVKTAAGRGLPELHSAIEPLIKSRMADVFGLTEIDRIVLKVERARDYDDLDDIPVSPELPDISGK